MKKSGFWKLGLYFLLAFALQNVVAQDCKSILYGSFVMGNNIQMATDAYELPETTSGNTVYHSDSIKQIMRRGNKAVSEGDFDSAFERYLVVYDMAIQGKDSLHLSKVYNNVGVINRFSGRHGNAVFYFHKKLDLLQQMGLKEERNIVKTILNIATEYLDLGIVDVAKEYYSIIINCSEKYPDLMVTAINSKAIMEETSGRYSSAMHLYEQALKICEAEKDTFLLLQVHNNIGVLFNEQENFHKGLEIYNKARNFYTKERNDIYFDLEINRMNSLYQLGEYERIEEMYPSLLAEIEEANKMYYLSQIFSIKGNLLFEERDFLASIAIYTRALKILDEIKLIDRASLVYVQLGNAYIEQGIYDKAITNLQKGLQIQKKFQHSREQMDSHFILSRAYEYDNDLKNALREMKLGLALKDSLYRVEVASEVIVIQEQYESEKKDSEISILKKDQSLQSLQLEKQESRNRLLVLIVALLLLLGYLLYKYLRSRSEKNHALLLKHKLQVEQRLLRVQMNPHFMFNSLNSIQGYVSENDSWHAEVYLSKFANLMRTTLEYSQREWVYLSEDIKNLNLYVALEQLRFQNQFDYNCEIDFDVDDEIMVPPMLLQPFVENAILHGLAPVKENGQLKVHIRMKGKFLEAVICDNGIGRAAASELKKGKHHRSMGVELTQKRIEMLDENIKDAVQYSEPQTGTGTKVCILIPVKTP